MITISTVGFGDMVATTVLGRVAVVVFGIFGGSLLLALLVAVFVRNVRA